MSFVSFFVDTHRLSIQGVRVFGCTRLLITLSLAFSMTFANASSPHTPSLEQLKKAAPTILVLGDSLSAAYGITAEQGWVYLLDKKLGALANNANMPRHYVVNASVSGATSAQGLQMLPSLLARHQPDIVILELGANDGLQGKPIAYISNQLKKLVAMSQHAGADVLLLGVRLPPNYGSAYTAPFFAQYATIATTANISLVPFFLDGVASDRQYMQADGLHPNGLGQPLILDNVWPYLQPLLKK